MNCEWCQEKYRGGRPDNFASDPECAFDEEGVFKADNWNCAGMDALRNAAFECEVWSEDQHAAVLPIRDRGDFIVLSYYKHRGRTEGAWRVSESRMTRLTTADVAEYIEMAWEPPAQQGDNKHG